MFIKDCTILYTATVGAAQFFSACSNKQTCFAGADFQEIIQKYIFGMGCAAVPFKFGSRGSASPGRHFRSSRSGPKPLQFQIKMPFVAQAQFEPS